MMKIYGIPNCGTIQKTLKYLDQKHIPYEFIDYKEFPLSSKEIQHLHEVSRLPIAKLFNTSGILYREMALKDKVKGLTLKQIYQLLATHPMLIKRPLLIDGTTVMVGFDEEKYNHYFKK